MLGPVVAGRVSGSWPLTNGLVPLQQRRPRCLLPTAPTLSRLAGSSALSAFSGKNSPLQRNRYWSRFGEDSEERLQVAESENAAVGRNWGEAADTLQQVTPEGQQQTLAQAGAAKALGTSVAVATPNMLRKSHGSSAGEQAAASLASGDYSSISLSGLSGSSSVDDYGKPLDFTDLAEEEAREAASRSKDPAAQSPYGKANHEVSPMMFSSLPLAWPGLHLCNALSNCTATPALQVTA